MIEGAIKLRLGVATLIALSALTVQPHGAAGQIGSPKPGELQKACDTMRRVLIDGSTAKTRDWAIRVAPACGRLGGEGLARALRDHWRDVERGPALERVVSATAALRDRSIYAEAAEIAGDNSVAASIRVQAIRVMYLQLNPGRFDTYDSFVTRYGQSSASGSEGPAVGEELPPDAVFRAATLAQAMLDDSTTPSEVRAAAEKLGRSARVKLVCPASVSLGECARRLQKKG